MELTLPSWAADASVGYELTGGASLGYGQGEANPNTATDAATGTVAIANHEGSVKVKLAHGQKVTFSDLPVGTRYSVAETDSTIGVNEYAPSAVFRYAGTGAAGSGYESKDNAVTRPAGATDIEVDAATGTANTSTLVGDADGNSVVVTNDLTNPPSPTGVIMYAAPAALPLVVVSAIAAIVLWQYSRRKRKVKESLL